MNTYKFVTLIVVSVLVAILLASALNGFTRVSDSALADTAPTATPHANAPSSISPAKRDYLPIIFLNSATAGGAWLLSGNSGTVDGTDFLGTTDNLTFTIRVSNTVALRIVPTASSPNMIGGYGGNTIGGAVFGATISGGGVAGLPNAVNHNYATVGGGIDNTAGGSGSFIGGGESNTATGVEAAIGGGDSNIVSGTLATVGGGFANTVTGYAATIGAGRSNLVSGDEATVSGGWGNSAKGDFSSVGGGIFNSALGVRAVVAGGGYNIANGAGAFIGGGGFDGSTLGVGNQAFGIASTIGGGISNTITNTGGYSFIGGGVLNTANGFESFIGAGVQNTANAQYATVAGGSGNKAANWGATVGGGEFNTASGYDSSVPGGQSNSATMTYTLAAGYNAHAIHQGVFVWADSTNAPFASTANDQFLIRAQGGVGIGTNAPGTTLEVDGLKNTFETMILRGTNSANRRTALLLASRTGSSPTDEFEIGTDKSLNNTHNLYFYDSVSTVFPIVIDSSDNTTFSGKVTAGGGFNGQCLSNGSNVFDANTGRSCNMDVAEGFAATELTAPGDLVALVTNESGAPTVRKSTNAYDELLIGVVSQNPGLVFDNGATHLSGDNSQLITADKTVVALVGRVNVKVSIENGAINIGDPLTSSSQPGIAMKATQAGKIIGYAMQSATNDGSVLALVQPGDYVPPAQLNALHQNATLEARVNELTQQVVALQSSSASNAMLVPDRLPVSRDALFIGALVVGGFIVLGRRRRV